MWSGDDAVGPSVIVVAAVLVVVVGACVSPLFAWCRRFALERPPGWLSRRCCFRDMDRGGGEEPAQRVRVGRLLVRLEAELALDGIVWFGWFVGWVVG